MKNTGTLQVTNPSNREVAMTRSMLSEMVEALSLAPGESDRRRSDAMLTASRWFIKQPVGLEGLGSRPMSDRHNGRQKRSISA
jgi:hypothetical protein